jgi:Ca-activated chloride channel family protein
MFHTRAYENVRPDGFSVLEIPPTPDSPRDAPRRFVPLRRTALTGTITGPLAALRLTQVYGFSRDECDQVVEAVYRFPLPGDAAVTAVRVRFGTVEIRAELKERQQAEADYEAAKQQGRQGALLTREAPDVFTLQVAGVEPGQDVCVETDYVQLARAEGVGWSLRVPLTTSPRYVRDDETGSRLAHGQPLALLRDPGHRFALDVVVAGAGSVTSPTHRLAQTAEDGRVRVSLEGGEVVPDRDCVLTWQPTREQERPLLQVFLHEEPTAGEVYFLALVAPPARRPVAGPPRETILLVDHSGSMQGPKWQAADWAVKKFLSELGERDVFALGLFHDTTRWHGKGVHPATAEAVQKAVAFLEKHHDSGGTQLGVALEQALDRPRFAGEAARHVLILTDAEVTDAGRVLRLADDEAQRPDRRRLDVLCIDAAPNAFLAHELAERGGGVCKFLTSAPEELDVTTALDEVLADWGQPVLTGLRLEVNRPQVQAAGRAVAAGASGPALDLGDLPMGRCVWVAGRVRRDEGALAFRLATGDGRKVDEVRLVLATTPIACPALKALFGARRILALEYLTYAGYDRTELTDQLTRLGYEAGEELGALTEKRKKVYAENERADVQAALRRLLVREALTYGLASAETAFVAVRTEQGQPVAGTVFVANALPTGWSEGFLGGPAAMLCTLAAPAPAAPAGYAAADSYFAMNTSVGAAPSVPHRLRKSAGAFGFALPSAGGAGEVSPTLAGHAVVFAGVPHFEGQEAVLFDSARTEDAERLPQEEATFVQLRVAVPGGPPVAELHVLLFVDDLTAPAARVRLADLVRQGGDRPLNLRKRSGERVRLVLSGEPGDQPLPSLEVTLCWT